MITQKDLELQYHRDTGTSPFRNDVSYTQDFYNWCVEKLLLELNKNFENEINRKPQNFTLE